MAEFSYNNGKHVITGETPFFLLYGMHLSLGEFPELERKDTEAPAAADRVQALQEIQKELQSRWDEDRRTQAKYYDRKVKPRRYAIGDRVWLSGRDIRTIRPSKKLDKKFYGSFKIVDAHWEQAYELDLKGTLTGIHPVFHISLLEPYNGRKVEEPPEPPPELINGEEEWEVEEIFDCRKKGKTVSSLVKWLGYSDAETQWEPEENLANCTELIWEFHYKYLNKLRPENQNRSAESMADVAPGQREGEGGGAKKARVSIRRLIEVYTSPFLSQKTKAHCLQFAQRYRNEPKSFWRRDIYTDESSFSTRSYRRRRVWRKEGERYSPDCIQWTFSSGRQSVMMWADIGYNFKAPLHLMTKVKGHRGIDAEAYRVQILEGHLAELQAKYKRAFVIEENALFMARRKRIQSAMRLDVLIIFIALICHRVLQI